MNLNKDEITVTISSLAITLLSVVGCYKDFQSFLKRESNRVSALRKCCEELDIDDYYEDQMKVIESRCS